MADAVQVSVVSPMSDLFPKPTPAGWVGSKAGVHGDLVTIDSNGKIDQAVAAGNPVGATTKWAVLADDVASTVAAASDDALAVRYQPLTDQDRIEMQLVNNSDTVVTAAVTHVGDMVGFYRCSDGSYAADVNTATHAQVVDVDTDRNTVLLKPVASLVLG